MKITGTVLDVKKDWFSQSYCVSGVKRQDAYKYKEPNYYGGCGTYRKEFPTTTIILNLVVRVSGMKHQFIDVREEVLKQNDRKKITDAFIKTFKSVIVGKKMEFETIDNKTFKLVNAESVKI